MAIDAVAADGATGDDVREALVADSVEQGIEETEGFFAGAEEGVVEEADDAGDDGGGG